MGFDNFSFGLRLKIETQIIQVSNSVLNIKIWSNFYSTFEDEASELSMNQTRLSCFNVKTKLLLVKISNFKLSKIILVKLVRLG